jgi:hypothetical protein
MPGTFVTRHAACRLAASILLVPLVFLLASCSGSVSGPATTTGALAISPTTATAYSDVPATFVVTGGAAPYFVSSSDQTALPVPKTLNSNHLTVIPGTVGADRSVTLNVTDAASSTTATATVTVRPRTVSNVVSITPSATTCGPTSICAGGDAVVAVTLTQNGVPLPGRAVRFDLVSGDLRFITSAPGLPESLSTTAIVTTDGNGIASIRVRALDGAPTQTALISITDTTNGASVQTAVGIVGVANPTLSAQPATIAFQGSGPNTCSNGASATVIITGGKAPYTISQSPAFVVSPQLVTSSPGQFTITSNGTCTAGSTIAIVDANGAATSVTATNSVSTTALTPVKAAPSTVTLVTCNQVAQVALTGGSGQYFAASGSDLIDAQVNGNFGFIRRTRTAANGTAAVTAAFSDGQSSDTVTVNLAGDPNSTGQAAGDCR